MYFLIIGGSGYIGHNLARYLQAACPNCEIVLADIKAPPVGSPFHFVEWDVRQPVPASLLGRKPDWIFNFAAVHREPGHAPEEYFDTNFAGARRVCEIAETTGCPNVFFTSSIAVYGPTRGATAEESPKYPTTPYGISKLVSEHIHREWQVSAPDRRLVICRPGVIYGPGETGNIPRMVKMIKRGLFAFPGRRDILKSYGYIEGLLESILFSCRLAPGLGAQGEIPARFVYNYVETPTEPLGELVNLIASELGVRSRMLSIPLWALVPVAHVVQILTGGRSGVHPMRVRKAATPTHIVPEALLSKGFVFRFPFAESLKDWRLKAPQDF